MFSLGSLKVMPNNAKLFLPFGITGIADRYLNLISTYLAVLINSDRPRSGRDEKLINFVGFSMLACAICPSDAGSSNSSGQ